MKSLIVVPARYGSTRLPGKPLLKIGGVTLLARMVSIARSAAEMSSCDFVIATDNEKIAAHARELGAPAVLTAESISSGTDRCLAAASALGVTPDFIVNLQGDSPFTPPEYIKGLISAATTNQADVYTVGLKLSWPELDEFRRQKAIEPYSGTTCLQTPQGRALWFSKAILPCIRGEQLLRTHSSISPVVRHVGLYGYRLDALRKYASLEPSTYELLEGLEQLRALEAGLAVHIMNFEQPRISVSGIDSREDVIRAEALLAKMSDPYHNDCYLRD